MRVRRLALGSAFLSGGLAALTPVANAMPLGLVAATPVHCAIPRPCAVFANTGAGTAVQGTGGNGAGLTGISTNGSGVYGTSASGDEFAPGVEGESTSGNGMDAAGLFGARYFSTGVRTAYGTLTYGSSAGTYGEAIGDGVATIGYGVFGQDAVTTPSSNGFDGNAGVFGQATLGTGVFGEANGTPAFGVYGDAPVGVYSVAKTAAGTSNPNAFTFFGETNSFGVDIHNATQSSTVFVSTPSYFLDGSGLSGSFSVDYGGNERLSGTLTTGKGGPYVRTTGSSGAVVREYGARMTAPDVEDVGEAQLANGRAYIPIDAHLADTIDRRVAYHVFVTPEGDCNGLYVTQKTPAGFAVRELRGGRSTLAFEYRIVAKPVDENGTRLAAMPPDPVEHDGISARAAHHLPPALAPQERLKRALGATGFAEALTALRRRSP